MSTEDRYAEIAALYDAMLPDDPDRASFFNSLFQRYKVQRVLDCACGTGNDLLLFHRLGYNVSGSDLSGAMLDVTKNKLRQAQIHLPLAKVDFQKLPQYYRMSFDAVVCLSNAINEDDVDVYNALASMQAVLNPKGIIIFDQGQTDFSLKDPPRFVPIVNNKDLSRLFTMEYKGNLMMVQIFDFLHQETLGKYAFYRSEHKIRLRKYADWEAILSSLSLEGEYYGSWQSEPYDIQKSMRMIVIAKKKNEDWRQGK